MAMSIDAKSDRRRVGRPRKQRGELSEWSRLYGSTLAERERLKMMREQDRQYKRDFIREHWREMSDRELADELTISIPYVRKIREELGLRRTRGRPKSAAAARRREEAARERQRKRQEREEQRRRELELEVERGKIRGKVFEKYRDRLQALEDEMESLSMELERKGLSTDEKIELRSRYASVATRHTRLRYQMLDEAEEAVREAGL